MSEKCDKNNVKKRWKWYEEHKKKQGKKKNGETPNKGALEHMVKGCGSTVSVEK